MNDCAMSQCFVRIKKQPKITVQFDTKALSHIAVPRWNIQCACLISIGVLCPSGATERAAHTRMVTTKKDKKVRTLTEITWLYIRGSICMVTTRVAVRRCLLSGAQEQFC